MTPERKQKLRRWARRGVLWGSVAVVCLLVVIELVGRFGVGLCDPPLMVADADMEYRFAPSQHCRMFGNDIEFNRYSMRAADFPEHKATSDEFRVMVVGDSIVYGGTKVDQKDLATARLRDTLQSRLKRPVVVGNISAGSWGPPNMEAYAKRYGFFDADVVVIVLSSHDAADAMTFTPVVGLDADFPTRKPRLALRQIATRYLPRFFAIWRQANTAPEPHPTTAPVQEVAASMSALRHLIDAARASGARVIVAQHFERTELDGQVMLGHEIIQETVHSTGIEPVQLGPRFKALLDRGVPPYRDFIHPSPAGQAEIAGAIEAEILDAPTPTTFSTK
jgi:hypothetical protein